MAEGTNAGGLTSAEGDAWDALTDDSDVICCCDGCNYYSPTYDETRECSLTAHIKRIIVAREVEAGRQALRDAAEALEDRDKHHCFRPRGCVECGRQYERDNRVQWLRVRADGLGGER